MQSRYSYPIISSKDHHSKIGTEVTTAFDHNDDQSIYVENTESLFGEIVIDDNEDEIDSESVRRDTMCDLHKSELMYSVVEKPIEISDFELVKQIK